VIEMKAGDIIFVRGKSPISKLIQYFDKGSFSHVAICLSNNAILEAQYFTKSRIVPFYFKNYEIVDLGLSETQRERVLELGLNLMGHYYDYIQVFSYFLRGVLNKELKIYNSPNNYICSELIDIILTDIGVISKNKYLGNITPNELYKYLKTIQR
jgi:translation initiation factor 2B subunit (eIF-2B alpha/beta/delta family)